MVDRSVQFLIIGAQKSATSWLYYCLRDHPEIHLPRRKREDIYLGGDLHQEHGTDWYFQHVGEPNDGQRVGDVSTDYLFDLRSPAAVEDELGDLKVMASLRSPLDRAISSYFWNMRKMNVRELDPNEGLRRAIKEWKLKQPKTTYDPEEYYFNIIARGMYAEQLERYVNQFGPESVYLLYYEDIRERPLDTLQRLYRALGVDPSFRPSSLTRRPKQNSYLRPLLRLERATPNNALFGKATDIAHQVVSAMGLGQERPSLSDEVAEQLRSLYKPSDDRLKKLVRRLPRSNVLMPGDPFPPWTTESS
jgi:hypothetical protein